MDIFKILKCIGYEKCARAPGVKLDSIFEKKAKDAEQI